MAHYSFTEKNAPSNFNFFVKSEKPLVSILIPAYKIPLPWMREMLDSVLAVARPYGNYELFLHDDGSEMPEMTRLWEEYAEKDRKIKLSALTPNGGIAVSRQILVERARGRYLLVFDADDVMVPFDLAEEIRFLEKHPDVVATYSRKFFFKDDYVYVYTDVGGFPPSSFMNAFSMSAVPNGALLRASGVKHCGGYSCIPPGITDDCALFSRLAFTGKSVMRPAPRVLARCHTPLHSSPDFAGEDGYRRFIRTELAKRPLEVAQTLKLQLPEVPDYLQRAVAGALCYVNQTDGKLLKKLLEFSISQFPDDFGCQGIYLTYLLQQNRQADFIAHCRRLMGSRRGGLSPYDCWLLLVRVSDGLRRGYRDDVLMEIFRRGTEMENYIPPEIRSRVKINS